MTVAMGGLVALTGASFVFLILLIAAICISRPVQIAPCSYVVNVGACDHLGECSVMLENGERHHAKLPVVGEKLCPSVLGWPIEWMQITSDPR